MECHFHERLMEKFTNVPSVDRVIITERAVRRIDAAASLTGDLKRNIFDKQTRLIPSLS
jgi:hypothetical protein